MKDANDSAAVGRAPERTDDFTARKLIRPALRENTRGEGAASERRERPAGIMTRKSSPPEQTNAENFYFQKQMQSKTPVVVVLKDNEQVNGVIEWYDKSCIKVTRPGQPNLLIYKPSIKYIFKAGEADPRK